MSQFHPQAERNSSPISSKPVTFISIHNAEKDPEDLAKRITEFKQKNHWHYIGAIDSGRVIEDSVTSAAYGSHGFPTTVIIGPDGHVAYVDPNLDGPKSEDPTSEELAEFERAANALMKSRFEAVGETWPIDENLDGQQQTGIFERAERRFIVHQIDTAIMGRR